jgi:hypothetical protein
MGQEIQLDKFSKAAKKETKLPSWYLPLVLLWSEEHVAGLCCEPYESNPRLPRGFLKIQFIIIFQSTHLLSTRFYRFQFQERRTAYIFIVPYVLRSQPNLLIFDMYMS